jgi:hypothetical protein
MVIMRSVRGHNSFQNPVNVNVALIQMAAVQFIAPLFWRIHSTFKLLKTLEGMYTGLIFFYFSNASDEGYSWTNSDVE